MRLPATWGGGPEIVALANALRRPIHVYEPVSSSDNKTITLVSAGMFGSPDFDDKVCIYIRVCVCVCVCARARLFASVCVYVTKRICCQQRPVYICAACDRFPECKPNQVRRHGSGGNHFLGLIPNWSKMNSTDVYDK